MGQPHRPLNRRIDLVCTSFAYTMIKTKRFTTNDQQAVDVHKSLVEELCANHRVPFMERGSYCTGHLAMESGGSPQGFATLLCTPAMRWKGERVSCMGNVEMQNNPKR